MFERKEENNAGPALPEYIEYLDNRSEQVVKLRITSHFDAGGFGSVLLAENAQHEQFAVKIGEVKTLERKYLLQCKEYYGHGIVYSGEKRLLFHVMKPRGNQNLMQMIRESIMSGDKITTEMAVRIIDACVREILIIHENGYSHNDIHPKNITLDDNGVVYIVDFGTISKLEDDNLDFRYLKNNVCPFLVAMTNTNDQRTLLGLLDNMVDSRCGAITKETIEKLLDQYNITLDTQPAVALFNMFARQPVLDALAAMRDADNDYQRFLLAKKYIADNPDEPLSKSLVTGARIAGLEYRK